MEEVCKSGQMVQDMMASGEMAWPMVTGDSYMPKVTSTKENGPKIKQMASEFTPITTEVDMKGNGSKINNMDMVLSNGQIVLNLKVNMSKV